MQTDAHALRRKAAFFFTAPRRDGKRWLLPGGQRAWLSKTSTHTQIHTAKALTISTNAEKWTQTVNSNTNDRMYSCWLRCHRVHYLLQGNMIASVKWNSLFTVTPITQAVTITAFSSLVPFSNASVMKRLCHHMWTRTFSLSTVKRNSEKTERQREIEKIYWIQREDSYPRELCKSTFKILSTTQYKTFSHPIIYSPYWPTQQLLSPFHFTSSSHTISITVSWSIHQHAPPYWGHPIVGFCSFFHCFRRDFPITLVQ